MEKIIETKICTKCSLNFEITDKDLEFYKKVSPKFDGKTYEIPAPTLCPDCRQQRRLSFRNERNLYKRKCDATGENIISIYSPDKAYKVYSQDFWWSDKWDGLDFGINFDFTKSFFEQFKNLRNIVPEPALMNKSSENSGYCHHATNTKNCYLIFGSADVEEGYYSTRITKSSNVIDSNFISNSEKIYNCVDIEKGYFLENCINCKDCSNSKNLKNCEGCQHCYGCNNLINKQYYIFNKEYNKKEFFEEIKNKKLKENIKFIGKKLEIFNSENVLGDYIYNSNEINLGFEIHDCEDIGYSHDLYNRIKTSLDCYSGFGPAEKCYEAYSFGVGAYNSSFIINCYPIKDTLYSISCFNSSNLFGCVGLKNKQYCILNKQYTKEEYNTLVPKIIEHMKTTGEWGEFFPSSISPFGYNETVANEYFPLSKEEILEQGFNYSNYEAPFPKVDKIIPANKLPENISDIPDDILNWAIECEVSKKPFRIIKQELEFYRKHNLPIPKKHPDVRHEERMKLRNPRKLFDRKCDKCEVSMKTTYSPSREEIVYCDKCYEKEVY